MTKQNKIKKTYHLEADVVQMVEELRVHYGVNYNTLANNVFKFAYKQMKNDVSFSNTEDLKKVLDFFKERLNNKDKEILELKEVINRMIDKNKSIEEDLGKYIDKTNKAINVINQHTETINSSKEFSSGLRKDVDELIEHKNKKLFAFSNKG